MKAQRVVRRRGSHIFYTAGSQMAMRLSALRTGRPEDSWYSFLLEAESTPGLYWEIFHWIDESTYTPWTLYCDMTSESRNSSFLGNGSVNTVPRKRTHAEIEERCFLWSAPRALLRNGAVNTSLQQWINTQQWRKRCFLWGGSPQGYITRISHR
jgi:hypothetical protein